MLDYYTAINLPILVLLHAVGLVALGLAIAFRRTPQKTLGLATFALGLAYLTTAYMPLEQNQFLHASVPVRLAVAALAAVSAMAAHKDEWQVLWGVAVYDTVGAVLCGLSLGRWDGRIAGY
jgi:hypothetical protein